MNFEHELETLRENMDAMGKGIQQAFADLLSAIAFNNLEELDRIQKMTVRSMRWSVRLKQNACCF